MSGGWKLQAKKHRKPSGTLTDWCDANLPLTIAARVALLVSKNEASPRVVCILKSYRTRSEVLSNVQRRGREPRTRHSRRPLLLGPQKTNRPVVPGAPRDG